MSLINNRAFSFDAYSSYMILMNLDNNKKEILMFLKNTHCYDTMVTIKKRGISCQKQTIL